MTHSSANAKYLCNKDGHSYQDQSYRFGFVTAGDLFPGRKSGTGCAVARRWEGWKGLVPLTMINFLVFLSVARSTREFPY